MIIQSFLIIKKIYTVASATLRAIPVIYCTASLTGLTAVAGKPCPVQCIASALTGAEPSRISRPYEWHC